MVDVSSFISFNNCLENNHFFVDEHNPILKSINDNKKKQTKFLEGNKDEFFRARIINHEVFNNPNINSDSPFEVLSPKELGVPPREKLTDGRANTKHDCYLYISTTADCAIYEVKPLVGSFVAIGVGRFKKQIKCYSLLFDECKYDDKLSIISHYFLTPLTDAKDYLLTQTITAYIKKLGFDAIIFSSSQYCSGKNIVLFEPNKFEFFESKLKHINSISYRW